MEQLVPVLTAAIASLGTWSLSRMQERQKSRQFDLEYVRKFVDEQIDDLRQERDRAHSEMMVLRERIAVLESQLREQERLRTAAIVRLQRENEELRKINEQMAIELRQLQAQLQPRPSK